MDGVFVYGTLLTGFEPHEALSEGLVRATPGVVEGYAMVHLPRGYPALFEAPGFTVHGELLEFEDLEAGPLDEGDVIINRLGDANHA